MRAVPAPPAPARAAVEPYRRGKSRMSHRPWTVALVQEAPVFLDVEATLESAIRQITRLAREGADVVVFPETWLPGYPVWIDSAPAAALWGEAGAQELYALLSRQAVRVGDERFERLRAAAGEAGAVVVIGAHERLGGTLYNTVFLFGRDGRWSLHRKLVPTYTERLLWGRGDGSTLRPLETEIGAVGALVCWEHWMPLARAAMHAQRELLHVAQWPWVRELHLVCSRQYAFEGQCFVAASGCCMSRGQMLEGFERVGTRAVAARALLESIPGDDDTLLLRGGSALIGPDIEYVVAPRLDSSEPVVGTIETAAVDRGHMYLDTAGHYARPDVFELRVDTSPRMTEVRFDGEGER